MFINEFYIIFIEINKSIQFLYDEVKFLRVKVFLKLEVDKFVYKIYIVLNIEFEDVEESLDNILIFLQSEN